MPFRRQLCQECAKSPQLTSKPCSNARDTEQQVKQARLRGHFAPRGTSGSLRPSASSTLRLTSLEEDRIDSDVDLARFAGHCNAASGYLNDQFRHGLRIRSHRSAGPIEERGILGELRERPG